MSKQSAKNSAAAKPNQVPALVVENVSVTYPGATESSIRHISFELDPKTITMLIGPNGSGKSTLLKAIIGVLPYEGKITYSKNQIQRFPHNHFRSNQDHIPETALGYVPQQLDFDLSLPVTVNDFLHLALLTCNHTTKEKERFIVNALERVQASALRHALLGSLSGGQRQRVILARALIHNPRLLVLDEPESGIDAKGEQAIYTLLKELVESRDLTVLIASHELEAVHRYADQVLCINKDLICQGIPEYALTEPSFRKLYGGAMIAYNHHHFQLESSKKTRGTV